MRKLPALLGVAFWIAAGGASAGPYRWASHTSTALTFVDMSTLTRSGADVDYWTLFLPLPTQAVPQLAMIYLRGHQHADCTRRTYRDLEVLTFKMDGEQIGRKDLSSVGDKPATEGGASAVVLDFVCTGKTALGSVEFTGSDAVVAAKVRSQLPH